MKNTFEQIMDTMNQLRLIKTEFASKGWFPGTSGNLSIRIGDLTPAPFSFIITASGKDKSINTPEDFLIVDQDGLPTEPTALKPSAETKIHCEIYKATGCGAIFHIHTVFNNIISEFYADEGTVPLRGVELIKAFNIWEQNASIQVPILPNYSDIPRVAELVAGAIQPRIPGILLRNHGIYAWGDDAFATKRHLEAFEFLFEYQYRHLLLQKSHGMT